MTQKAYTDGMRICKDCMRQGNKIFDPAAGKLGTSDQKYNSHRTVEDETNLNRKQQWFGHEISVGT